MVCVQVILEQAWQHYQAGNWPQAQQLYQEIVAVDPQQADAWHSLGMLACQSGRPEQAVDLIERAIRINPHTAAYHNNLGVAWQALGRFDEALATYREAVLRQPDYAPAHNNIGKILCSRNQWAAGVESFERAVQTRADFAEAWQNLGDGLCHLDKAAQAVYCYEQAVTQQPSWVDAHNNLGVALLRLGQPERAIACFQRALQLQPDFTEARHNLFHLSRLGYSVQVGVANLVPATTLSRSEANEYLNLARMLHKQGRLTEAEDRYRQSLELLPEQGIAHQELGTLLQIQRRFDMAETCYREAIRIQPNLAAAHNNLGILLKNLGRLSEALASYRQALRIDPRYGVAYDNLLLDLNYAPDIDNDTLFAEHRRWAALMADPLPVYSTHINSADPERRLRIGYVSPDFHWHPVTWFFEPLLRHRDRNVAEVFLYADVKTFDATSSALKASADHWRDVTGMSDYRLAELVRADAIDILVDLAGHTGDNRLLAFARKPAPIQVTYLGYPNTTGLTTIDYRITDAIADPEGKPNRHSETLLRLDPVFCCYAPPVEAPTLACPPVAKRGYITLGCFQNLAKLNHCVLDLWSQLLQRLPGAKLRLCRDTLQGSTRKRLEREFTSRGVAADRLELVQVTYPRRDHLAVYADVDISLDTFPWNGHTTACEAMWMGVPVITMRGVRHASRMVASVLSCLGLSEWIADTPEAYLAAVEFLSKDHERLRSLRHQLRDQMRGSPLCDGKSFMSRMEEAYRKIWRRWVANTTMSP
jgi:predicted O-linked N-acetylglucosamine transferase (SPINDLY family)